MPQDSGPEPKADRAIAAAAARILEEVKAESVPQPILDLAEKLDRSLQARRSGSTASEKAPSDKG
jgi:hypothetical protein